MISVRMTEFTSKRLCENAGFKETMLQTDGVMKLARAINVRIAAT